MEYLLELGQSEQLLARQSYLMGQPLPDRIANAPELYQGLELYLQAFLDLDSERSHAMGLTSIPWSAMRYYAIAFDFSADQTDDLLYLVKGMDIAHMKRLDQKNKG